MPRLKSVQPLRLFIFVIAFLGVNFPPVPVLQVLMHAARNFALQEHAIENTESVSRHIVQFYYCMILACILQFLL
jgi:hypothetical protein